MTRNRKLMEAIQRNPAGIRFVDACKAAEMIGFVFHGGTGSHRVYKRPESVEILNFQNRGGYIAAYQARQLIALIEKYEGQP